MKAKTISQVEGCWMVGPHDTWAGGHWIKQRSFHVPAGAQGQAFRLRVEPQNPVVPTGGTLLVNCSTDCPQPELISLETSLFKEEAGEGLGWKAYWLSNVTGDSEIFCSGICNGSQMSDSSDITVYRE